MTCCRNMWLLLMAAVLVLRAPLGTSAADSPCPDVFQYVGSPGSEYGIITVPNPYPLVAVDLSVSIYVTAPVSSHSIPKLEPVDTDVWKKLAAGFRDPVLYRIDFQVSSPLPTIKGISVNKKFICIGSKPNAAYVNTVKIQHAIYNERCNSTSLDCPFNIQQSAELRPQTSPNAVSRTGSGRRKLLSLGREYRQVLTGEASNTPEPRKDQYKRALCGQASNTPEPRKYQHKQAGTGSGRGKRYLGSENWQDIPAESFLDYTEECNEVYTDLYDNSLNFFLLSRPLRAALDPEPAKEDPSPKSSLSPSPPGTTYNSAS